MFRISDLRHKDIVNSIDGKRLGYIKDIELDLNEGRIKAIILPGENRLFSLFGRNDDIVVDWQQVKKIGVDVVLVELPGFTSPTPKEEKEAEQLYENAFRKRERYQKKASKKQSEYEDTFFQGKTRGKSLGNYEERYYNPQKNKEYPTNDYYNPKADEYLSKESPPDDIDQSLEENNYNYYPPDASGKAKPTASWQDSPLWHSPIENPSPKVELREEAKAPKPAPTSSDSKKSVSTPLKWGDEAIRQEKNNLLGKWGDKTWDQSEDWNNETDWSQPPPNWLDYQEKISKK